MSLDKWQLYDLQGQPNTLTSATKHEIAFKGLLHGAAHVWLWRLNGDEPEVLLQKRARTKIAWPLLWDKSAGGHIMFGEHPLNTAIRRTREELGIDLKREALQFIGTNYSKVAIEDTGLIEHEYQWLYLVELRSGKTTINCKEIDCVTWKKPSELRADLLHALRRKAYVPYTRAYCAKLIEAIEKIRIGMAAAEKTLIA